MENLPDELLYLILLDLDYKDIMILSKVNRSLANITKDNLLWFDIYKKRYLPNVKYVSHIKYIDYVKYCEKFFATYNTIFEGFEKEPTEIPEFMFDIFLYHHDINTIFPDSKTTLIFYSSKVRITSKLIRLGADVNHVDKNGENALFYTEDIKIVKLLLDSEIDPDIVNNEGLNIISDITNPKLAELYVRKGVSYDVRNFKGETPLFTVQTWQIAQILIRNFANVNVQNNLGETPLMKTDNSKIAALLIENEAETDFMYFDEDGDKEFNISVIAYTQHPEVVETMLRKIPGINLGDIGPYNRNIFFHVKSLEMAKEFYKYYTDIDARDEFGNTALFKCEDLEVAKFLIDKGADVDARNDEEQTPLFLCQKPKIAQLLIDEGAEVDAVEEAGFTPFLWNDNIKVLEVLFKNGADVNHVEPIFGRNKLFFIGEFIEKDIKKMILEFKIDINHRDKKGLLPIDFVGNYHKNMLRPYSKQI